MTMPLSWLISSARMAGLSSFVFGWSLCTRLWSHNQEIQIIKQADTVELPCLGALPADDYFKAIEIDESATGEEGLSALQRKTRNFATLFEISTMLSRSVDESEMLQQVLDILLKVPGGDFAYVALLADGILVPKVVRSNRTQRAHYLEQNHRSLCAARALCSAGSRSSKRQSFFGLRLNHHGSQCFYSSGTHDSDGFRW